MEIKRDSYLEQIKIRKDNGMIKIITGIRRCGKSFLSFVLFGVLVCIDFILLIHPSVVKRILSV